LYSVDKNSRAGEISRLVGKLHVSAEVFCEDFLSENPSASLVPLGRGHHEWYSSVGQDVDGFAREEEDADVASGWGGWAVGYGDCLWSDFVSFYSVDIDAGLSLEAVEIFKFDEFSRCGCIIREGFCPLDCHVLDRVKPCPYRTCCCPTA
jgi:hypothetical protein